MYVVNRTNDYQSFVRQYVSFTYFDQPKIKYVFVAAKYITKSSVIVILKENTQNFKTFYGLFLIL